MAGGRGSTAGGAALLAGCGASSKVASSPKRPARLRPQAPRPRRPHGREAAPRPDQPRPCQGSRRRGRDDHIHRRPRLPHRQRFLPRASQRRRRHDRALIRSTTFADSTNDRSPRPDKHLIGSARLIRSAGSDRCHSPAASPVVRSMTEPTEPTQPSRPTDSAPADAAEQGVDQHRDAKPRYAGERAFPPWSAVPSRGHRLVGLALLDSPGQFHGASLADRLDIRSRRTQCVPGRRYRARGDPEHGGQIGRSVSPRLPCRTALIEQPSERILCLALPTCARTASVGSARSSGPRWRMWSGTRPRVTQNRLIQAKAPAGPPSW